jgi:hypothetical protein
MTLSQMERELIKEVKKELNNFKNESLKRT